MELRSRVDGAFGVARTLTPALSLKGEGVSTGRSRGTSRFSLTRWARVFSNLAAERVDRVLKGWGNHAQVLAHGLWIAR